MDRVSSGSTHSAVPLRPSAPSEVNSSSGGAGEIANDLSAVRRASSDMLVPTETNARKTLGLPESVGSFWVYDKNTTQYQTFRDDFKVAVTKSVNEYIEKAKKEIVDYTDRENEAFDKYKEFLFGNVNELRVKFEAAQSEANHEIELRRQGMNAELLAFTSERSSRREDLIREMLLNVSAEETGNRLDGLEYMVDNFPSEFQGFPPSKYHQLLVNLYNGWEIRIDGLIYFSLVTKTNSSAAMREEIQKGLLEITCGSEEVSVESRRILQTAVERCMEHAERNWDQSAVKFVENLLFGVCEIPSEAKLLALREYCAMFPDQIKNIDKRDLCRLIATISLGGSEISEALKCLGETSGYIFLPDEFFLLWQAAAETDLDSREGRRRRFTFSEAVADGIEKIVRDGRDVDEVYMEFLFGLTRINKPERLNAVKLICAEFKHNLSRVFLKFGSAEVVEFIEQCIPHGEVKSALEDLIQYRISIKTRY